MDFGKLGGLGRLGGRTVSAAVVVIAGILVCGMLLNSLSARRTDVERLRTDVEAKEALGARVQLPTEEELRAWTEQESRVGSILLSDETVPFVYEEISRIATETRLQRFTMATLEKTVDETGASGNALDSSLQAIGVKRYLAITVKFRADYRDAAAFVGKVAQLPRSLAIDSLQLRRDPPLVEGTVVINVYKRSTA